LAVTRHRQTQSQNVLQNVLFELCNGLFHNGGSVVQQPCNRVIGTVCPARSAIQNRNSRRTLLKWVA